MMGSSVFLGGGGVLLFSGFAAVVLGLKGFVPGSVAGFCGATAGLSTGGWKTIWTELSLFLTSYLP